MPPEGALIPLRLLRVYITHLLFITTLLSIALLLPQVPPEGALIPPRLLRAYITLARRQQPAIPQELTDYVAAHYVEARGQEASELGERGAYITPRTLMSILRLSQVRSRAVWLSEGCLGICCLCVCLLGPLSP